jgi:hypothetical protein
VILKNGHEDSIKMNYAFSIQVYIFLAKRDIFQSERYISKAVSARNHMQKKRTAKQCFNKEQIYTKVA